MKSQDLAFVLNLKRRLSLTWPLAQSPSIIVPEGSRTAYRMRTSPLSVLEQASASCLHEVPTLEDREGDAYAGAFRKQVTFQDMMPNMPLAVLRISRGMVRSHW